MNKIQVKHWRQMARFDRKTFYKVIKEEFGENNPFYFFVKERN